MNRAIGLMILLAALLSVHPADAQESKKKKKNEVTAAEQTETPAPAPKKKNDKAPKTIEEVTEACHKMDGFFPIYQDTTNGKTYLEISEDQIGKEIIYFKHIQDGVREAGHIRGIYRDKRLFRVEKYYDRIELRELNTSYYFDPENALSNASKANINEPVVFSQKIAGITSDTGEVKTTRYVIEADDLFLDETINQMKPSMGSNSSRSFNLGKISKSKSKYISINNYPENTDVIVEYAFENPYPKVGGGAALTNARYVSLVVRHSLIEAPDNDYKPRYDDSRVGYFLSKVTDQTSTSATPYRDVIRRWNLVKKDPTAEISEPVEPIVWWIENTTPHEIRDVIRQAGERWNEAFEKAGFRNALIVKVQPDDAEWDAGDIRYNVLRWTSSPSPTFGGYGPSFSDPRTGQILGADIMFEFVKITNRIRQEQVFDVAGMADLEESEEMEWLGEGWDEMDEYCSAAQYAQYEYLTASYAGAALGFTDSTMSELLRQSISRVVLHEIGHTLGLSHNFCASQSISMEDLNNKELTDRIGLSASVMDYHATNLSLDKEAQGAFVIDQPGVYDEWAVEYGYREFPDEESERQGLDAILARSVEPGLCFGNDADDMRSPGRGMDPRINVSDLTSDAIGFSIGRMELVKQTMPTILENLTSEGSSYHAVRNAYTILTGNYSGALNVVSKYIGGVHLDRARVGQETENKPLTPVAYADQKRAMSTLNDYAFAPGAFDFGNEVLQYLKLQRRGWDHRGSGEDPHVHSRVLNMQKKVLMQLLHPMTLQRITDSGLYGNAYSVSEMMEDLTAGIFNADLYVSVNTFRQQLQLDYVERLGKLLNGGAADYPAQSAALFQLNSIKSKMTRAKSPDTGTAAHRQHVLFTIDKILETDN